MGCKTCVVTIHDLNDTAHSVDVTAETLYDALAQAIVALRGHEWAGEIGRGLTTATVMVRQPEVRHTIRVQDFERWLSRPGKTPAEITLKSRLRQVLGKQP